jgi:hypothetical protein
MPSIAMSYDFVIFASLRELFFLDERYSGKAPE